MTDNQKTTTNNPQSPLLPCSRCHQTIQRKWNRAGKRWSPINNVAYWAEAEDDSVKQKQLRYQFLCRSCLVAWYREEREDFFATVTKTQRDKFQRYRYIGYFSKNDLLT